MKTNKFKIAFPVLILNLITACSEMKFVPDNLSSSSSLAIDKMAYTEVVAAGNKQVDFLVVLDDSNSMAPELTKLAARMAAFVASLDASGIDWQMCMTTTRALGGQWGSVLPWQAYTPVSGVPPYLLKKGSSNLDSVFKNTIAAVQIGVAGSGDERAIKSTYESFTASSGCYRAGSAISVIAISDEDERSVGGDLTKVKTKDAAAAYQALEAEDLPENLIAHSRQVFGDKLRFTFNSIVVKPGDTQCEALQDLDTSPSHAGYVYSSLSNLTGGGVASICEADYSGTLNTFKDKVVNSLNQLTLRCEPEEDSLVVKVNGGVVTNYSVAGRSLNFAQSLVEGTRIDLVYDCPRSH